MNELEIEKWKKHFAEMECERLTRIAMAYDCDCGARTYFVLDRFPMSSKIGFVCESCRKFNFNKLVHPFIFYINILGELSTNQIAELNFSDPNDPQKDLLNKHLELQNIS